MFPRAGPGAGLLLLRMSVAATFVLSVANGPTLSSVHPLLPGASVIALCLAIGFLTPYLSFVVCVYALVKLFGVDSRPDELVLASVILNAAALGLLGPGAYSVDARLFGRRVVVVPSRRDADEI
jgi:hypothetical protein